MLHAGQDNSSTQAAFSLCEAAGVLVFLLGVFFFSPWFILSVVYSFM